MTLERSSGVLRKLATVFLCGLFAIPAAPLGAATPRGGPAAAPMDDAAGSGALRSFRSEAELRAYLRDRMRRLARQRGMSFGADGQPLPMPPPPPAPPPPPMMAQAAPASPAPSAGYTAESAARTSITNNQTAGVDEGDIVKLHGDVLVILRRGRLFTVSLAGGSMRPVSQIDVTPPGARASGSDWYDELLVAGDRVVVIGYSYRHGGSDIYRFRITRDGRLSFQDAHQLRSSDYYSDRNYASRMIGNELVLYTPLPLEWQRDPLDLLPGLRPWREGEGRGGYRPLARAQDIYLPSRLLEGDATPDTLHTVTRCDVTAPVFDCRSIGVLGSRSRTFYVSQSAVYVWTNGLFAADRRGRASAALLYRLPLTNRLPTAVGVRGAPIDQFSFREDAGVLNVMVRSQGGGDAMWNAEFSEGKLALLRLPLRAFGDGGREAEASLYRPLPDAGPIWTLHDRYVGRYLLYGGGSTARPQDMHVNLVAVPLDGGPITQLPLPHGVDRIEALGSDGLAVGSTGNDVVFTAIELTRGRPQIGDRYVRRNAAEAENRSHGFFYRPDEDSPDGASGILGLPVAKPASPRFASLFSSSASMLFLRRQDRALSPMGELEAGEGGVADDHCVASCVDWYGNARPIFIGRRVFALLGYELVEGEVRGRRIGEVNRVSFAPAARAR
jgi:hypothetical protein